MTLPILNRLDRLAKPGLSKWNDREQQVYEVLRERFIEELMRPTRIAVIGKTGVGKTSTINAIFGTDWEVSHVRAATKSEQVLNYEGKRGKLRISDLPGIGEDIDTEAGYTDLYLRVLQECEVAVFVLKADTRDMREVQLLLQKILASATPGLARRLVIGLNQVDLVQPGSWIQEANIPSSEQEDTIKQIVNERYRSIRKVCSISRNQIVAYSALKRYRLAQLFAAMIARTAGEAWVLDAKKHIADWKQLVDPKYLPARLRGGNDGQ